MEPWSTLALDQPQLKSYLSVLLKERRQEKWEDLSCVANRAGLPVRVLGLLESNEFAANIDPDLIRAVAQGYQLSFNQLAEMVRVACVANLVKVIKALDDTSPE